MSARAPIEYSDVRSIRGPLLVVEGVAGVGWDEAVEIRLAGGETRTGVVLDVHEDLAVVEVYEGTSGMERETMRVTFSGSPLQIPVGEEWLGRVCDGRGRPLDGGPPVAATRAAPVAGRPINPTRRAVPNDPILTGVSAIDALATFVRGQKLPIFSVGGLPHLELAAQIAVQASAGGEPFAVVFAAVGLTHVDAAAVRDTLERRAGGQDTVLLLNTAADPVIERLLTPRIALTIAEELAFVHGRHVLAIIADLTNYCEALREVSAARGEIPGRRAYPGYLYSDVASLLERAGRIEGNPGSLTQLPVLTMPGGDIGHPIPDVTGYITEGQLLLSPEMHTRGIYPPFDALGSLSRLMRRGAGPGLTREDHLEISAQLYSLASRARQVSDLAEVIGPDALSDADRRYLPFTAELESRLISQPLDRARSLEDTLERAWRVASTMPRQELSMLGERLLDTYYTGGS